MRRFAAFLAMTFAVVPASCYRHLSVLECDAPNPPAYCIGASSSTGASSEPGASIPHEPGTSTGDTSTSSTSTGDTSTSTTTDPETTGTSTGAAPLCGDGALDESSGEECDDGNLVTDDGCNVWCKRDRRVFVSSQPGFIAGQLQGLQGADNYCMSRAGQAGLPEYLKYRAFLSDSQTDAVDRLFAGQGRYVLVDGTVVAENWQALLSEPLQHPIDLTELGELSHVGVWTGTRYGDGRAVPGSHRPGATIFLNLSARAGGS